MTANPMRPSWAALWLVLGIFLSGCSPAPPGPPPANLPANAPVILPAPPAAPGLTFGSGLNLEEKQRIVRRWSQLPAKVRIYRVTVSQPAGWRFPGGRGWYEYGDVYLRKGRWNDATLRHELSHHVYNYALTEAQREDWRPWSAAHPGQMATDYVGVPQRGETVGQRRQRIAEERYAEIGAVTWWPEPLPGYRPSRAAVARVRGYVQ